MNTKTNLKILITFLTVTLTVACSKGDVIPDDPCGSNWAKITEAEAKDVSEKAIAFSQNPTPTTCETYKASYLRYIDALKKAGTCFLNPQDKAEYQQALNDAETNAKDLDCNDFD